MRLLPAVILALVGLASQGFALQRANATIVVSNLQAGSVLQGIYPIQGTIQADQFISYEVNFGYSDDQTGTWFLIAQATQPVQDGVLASWDTTQITDGNYRLRVLVRFTDGSTQEQLVPDLRVRNYTPPDPNQATPELVTTSVPVSTTIPTATPSPMTATSTTFSANPGSMSQEDFQNALLHGAGISGGIFILIGLYLVFRKRPHRR